MRKKFRDKIKDNFVQLVDQIDPDVLADILLLKRALVKEEVEEIFRDRKDIKHINRLLLFRILKKSDSVYHKFLQGLEQINLKYLLTSSSVRVHATTVCRQADDISDTELLNLPGLTLSSTDLEEETQLPVKEVQVLDVKVTLAKDFQVKNYDNEKVYDTTSKKRGQVLIINNENFDKHTKREGSQFDVACLKSLFEQMFMKVQIKEDISCDDMRNVIFEFAKFDADRISDVCIVIIMSHGEQRDKDQVVLDRKNADLKISWIEEQFSNVNCSLFNGKPKIFLYQLCRGTLPDHATTKRLTLENKNQESEEIVETQKSTQHDSGPIRFISRRLEDVFIGYATQKGRIAHRDPTFGSWYIRLICEVFMKRAHNTHLIDMMNEVDERLKDFTSKDYTMQTSSYTSKGFNKHLYFNPGIYKDSSGNVQNLNEKGVL